MTPEHFPKLFSPTLRRTLPRMLDTLRQLTLLESPSLEKEHADRCCGFLADEWLLRGTLVQVFKQKSRRSSSHRLDSHIAPPRAQLLVLGHYDTVYPTGTLANMPFASRVIKPMAPAPLT